MMEVKDNAALRQMSEDELNTELLTLRKEQFKLRMRRANGSLDKFHTFSLVKKAIARVKTIMSEKGRNK
jgi:large subunit ribosomal protein L29